MTDLYTAPDGLRAAGDASAAVMLVGGYDGSANFGDIAQFDAALELAERLGPRVAVLPVVEALHRGTHERLYPDAAGRPALAATLFYAPDHGADTEGLAPATLPSGLRAGAIYLYGGGYLNRAWGPRKLAMLRAAESLLRAAGLPLAGVASSGLQIDAEWLAGLDPVVVEPLRRMRRIGVRDAASRAALAAVERPGVLTGDDAVACLAPWAATATGVPDGQVNIHVSTAGWVTGAAEPLLAHCADVLAALATPELRVQPIIAYDDPHTSEHPAADRLRALCSERGIAGDAFAPPLPARPDALAELVPAIARGRLTLSCSYHVALASLLAGVPAALVAENGYYAQKSAGLQADFGLPDAFLLRPDADAAASARALDVALPAAREAVARSVGPVLARRLRAERDVLAELAHSLIAGTADSPVGGGEEAGALALALLRADHQTLVARSAAEARRAAAAEAALAASAEQRDRLVAELGALGQELGSEREARIWFEQALAVAQDVKRGEIDRRADAEQVLADVATSLSWRLTAPARALARRLRGNRR